MDTMMQNQRGPPISQQQQQQPQQPQLQQQPFQGSFNCYEAFPVTSPPDAQFYQQQSTQNVSFLPPPQQQQQQQQQQTSSQNQQSNDELSGYMSVGDPQQQQQLQQQQSQSLQQQLQQPSQLQLQQQQQPQPPQGGYYYYQQPVIGQISNNQSAFGFQSNLRSLPGGNPQMSAIQSQLPEQSMQSQFMQPMPPHGALMSNTQLQQQQQQQQQKRKEVYRYTAPHELYSCSWSMRPEAHLKFRIAVGSFIEEYNNKISIVQLREEQGDFLHIGTFDHPYPSTKILWIPDPKGAYPDLMATTGDYLRLWRVGGHHGASLEVMLNNNRTSDYCAPLTSSDWNETDVSLIGTSSIDTTCTIWQIETGQVVGNTARATEGTVKTQLIAHDKEVYDIAFSKLGTGREIFASVGADGSVRMFDLRHMEYSTILFEEPNRKPLLRLAWNRQDHNYLATFAKGSNEAYILDIRVPSMPIATLKNHSASVSGLAWAPHSSAHICTAGDDSQALIWDLRNMPRPVDDPILAYAAGGEINHVAWSTIFTDWISICYGNQLELLRV